MYLLLETIAITLNTNTIYVKSITINMYIPVTIRLVWLREILSGISSVAYFLHLDEFI